MRKFTLQSFLGRQGLKLALATALLLTGQAVIAQNVLQDTLLLDPTGAGGFEVGADFASNGWTAENYASANTNKWYVGTASSPTNGTRAVYISSNNGANNAYITSGASSRVMFWRDITFPAGYSNVTLTFKIRVRGEKGTGTGTNIYYDDLSVHFQTGNTQPTMTQPSATSNEATIPNATRIATLVGLGTNYVTKSYTLNAGNASVTTTRRLIFYWKNNNNGIGTQPPPSIDEIEVSAYSAGPFPNDDADSATLLTLGAGCTGVVHSNFQATAGTGEPTASCRSSFAGPIRPVWFKFVAPASGMVRISTDNGGILGESRTAVFSAGDSSDYSTFNIMHCAGNSGVTSASNNILYPTGLIPGQTYYIVMDVYYLSSQGAFCITVDELDNTMLSTTATDCAAGISMGYAWTGTNDDYNQWMSLVDNQGKLIANLRQLTGDHDMFPAKLTIKSGAPRTDVNGLSYLNRNYSINGTGGTTGTTSADVQFFFTDAELANLGVAVNSLNISRVPDTACTPDFTGTATLLTQSASGSANGVSWLQVNTPGFSNFFIHQGTTPLPVELISFEGRSEKGSNVLEWKMADEKGISHFELQRSPDGIRFATIGNVKANGSYSYKFSDVNPDNGKNHYRLAVQKGDKTSLSEIVSIYSSKGSSVALNVYPNPVNAILQVNIGGNIAPDAQIELTDLTGRIVLKQNVNTASFQINMHGFASGTYLLRYTDSKNQSVIKLSKN